VASRHRAALEVAHRAVVVHKGVDSQVALAVDQVEQVAHLVVADSQAVLAADQVEQAARRVVAGSPAVLGVYQVGPVVQAPAAVDPVVRPGPAVPAAADQVPQGARRVAADSQVARAVGRARRVVLPVRAVLAAADQVPQAARRAVVDSQVVRAVDQVDQAVQAPADRVVRPVARRGVGDLGVPGARVDSRARRCRAPAVQVVLDCGQNSSISRLRRCGIRNSLAKCR
jgi:hypothetical protein